MGCGIQGYFVEGYNVTPVAQSEDKCLPVAEFGGGDSGFLFELRCKVFRILELEYDGYFLDGSGGTAEHFLCPVYFQIDEILGRG